MISIMEWHSHANHSNCTLPLVAVAALKVCPLPPFSASALDLSILEPLAYVSQMHNYEQVWPQ